MEKEALKGLLDVAKGKVPPDTIIRNGKIVNVFTNRIEENLSVVIKDGLIVSIGENDGRAWKNVQTIDAEGSYLCPGFIDAHTHLDGSYPFYEFVPYSIRGGTTTVISECTMIACSCGKTGVDSFVESTKGYPVRCYFVAPPVTPPFPKMEGAKGLNLRDFSKLLKREDFLGIGEGYWTRVVDGEERILKQASLALTQRKRLDGHAAGARGNKLVQYLLTGITSCHESTSVEEALEKLRFGLYVMIREGFVRRELEELSRLMDMDVDKRRLIMVSDFFDGVMLYEEGYLDSIVRTAIRYGIQAMDAIKMVTINPADYLGLRHLGAIAPLRYADILFLKNLEDVSIDKVMTNGEIVFCNNTFTKTIQPFHYPEAMMHTIKAHRFQEENFKVKASRKNSVIRAIDIINTTITKEITCTVQTKDGYIQSDPKNDLIPVAVINRTTGKVGKGLIKGTGIQDGALATTFIWDTSNILVVGSCQKDMEVAVNRLIDLQGGMVMVKQGRVLYEFPMPVYGLIPLNTIPEIREKTKASENAMKEMGTSLERPFMTIQTISFTGLPFFRITDKGLVDIKNKKIVPLFLN